MTIETKFDEEDIAYHKIRYGNGLILLDMKPCEINRIHIDYFAGQEFIEYECIYCDEDNCENTITISENDLADEQEYQEWLKIPYCEKGKLRCKSLDENGGCRSIHFPTKLGELFMPGERFCDSDDFWFNHIMKHIPKRDDINTEQMEQALYNALMKNKKGE